MIGGRTVKTDIAQQIRDSIAVKEQLLKAYVPLIENMALKVSNCLMQGGKLLFMGNGGSASDSQHLAAEFVGRYEKERRPLAAVALTTDTSILTAVGNDYGFEKIFERQIEALGKKGDVLFAISTSGNSKNVLIGVHKAKQMNIYTIGFSGGSGGELKSLVDLSLVIPSKKTSRIQESHIFIGHMLCECVDEVLSAQS
jgi:D-sedoheptulose 7-phosphate isomerase